jgi:hypothetical protein
MPNLRRAIIMALLTLSVFAGPCGAQSHALMFRGFTGVTAQTCSSNAKSSASDQPEVIVGATAGWHQGPFELGGGGIINACPDSRPLLTAGMSVFPFRSKSLLVGGGLNFDFSPGTASGSYNDFQSYWRPEVIVEVLLSHKSRVWTDDNDAQHESNGGFALDLRGGVYEARAAYFTVGFVLFSNSYRKQP